MAEERWDVLTEQLDYYRARAAEYDRWFYRQGRYDRGEEANGRWFSEIEEVKAALQGVPIEGRDILELAPGTGIWTEMVARTASHVTAVDGSSEMIAINRAKLGEWASNVTYVEADLFAWEPERTWDGVLCCFWISHVPDARLGDFLRKVRRMLRPGGCVFFVDGRREPTSTANDHVLPEAGVETMVRRLDDGREFRIVKNYWSCVDLEARCKDAGLTVDVRETPTYFQYGIGTRR